MKTNEQLRKSRDHSLLLPQKWLVCLLTLLATFVGSSKMWADDAEFGFVYTLDNGSWVNPRWTTIENVTNSGEQHGSSVNYYSQQESKVFKWNGSDDTNATTYWRTGSTALTDFSDDQWVGYTLTPAGSGVLNISHVTAQIVTQGQFFYYKVKILNSSDEVLSESSTQEVQNYGSVQKISSDVNLTNLTGGIKVRLYVYVKDNGTTKYFVVNNLQVRGNYQAQLYSYSIKTTGVGTQYTLASGTVEPNTSVTVPYRRYFDVNGQLYEAPKTDDNKKQYNKTFTINSDNYEGTVDYADANVSNIVYLSEAEAISGMTETSEGNANVRCSDAKGAYAPSNVNFFTPAAGKYKIKGSVWGNNGTTFTIMAGDKTVWSGATTGSYTDYTSEEFSIDGTTPLTIVQAGDKNHSLDYIYVVKTGDYTPVVSFELDGGTGDTTAPINEEITLPTPTKAGYSFIGWMNANTDITPTAGYPGAKKTYTEATTLYALWYKNNCEIDFTSAGPLNGTPSRAGVSISETGVFMAGGTPVGNITINEHDIDTRFGVQTGTSWIYYNNGLYSNNSGGRAYGINGCLEGEYITISSSVNPNVNTADAELVYNVGNTYVYKVKKDGSVKFTPARYSALYSVAVASPCPHTIWTDGNVGPEDKSAGWWTNFSEFYKLEKGKEINFKFTNKGTNTEVWFNWVLDAQIITKHNGDLGVSTADNERLMLRADGHSWGTKNGTSVLKRNDIVITADDQFKSDMENAEVDMSVKFNNDGTLTVHAVTTAGGNTYDLSHTSRSIDENTLYLTFVVEKARIEGISHPIKFADTTPKITTSSTGTITYSQPALGNPEGTWVKYEIVEFDGVENPSISQIEGSSEYILNIKGTGTVKVRATCGDPTTGHAETAEYILTVDGLMFENPSPYIAHGKTWYNAPLTGGAEPDKVEIVKYDTTPCLRADKGTKVKFEDGTCKIYDIPHGENDGGIIVIRATKGDAVAECCLTVAYDLHIWDMYSDPLKYGTLVEGNDQDAINGDGETMKEENRVGSAHYVIYKSGNSYEYSKTVNGEDQSVTDGNRVAYNNWMDGQDYYAKEKWYNEQTGTKTCNVEGGQKNYDVLHKYWRFTYKTCSYKDGVRTYVNEPLFAYKNTVIGDNGRIIKQTAGLRYNAPALHFGVSDNDTKNGEGANRAIREQDRCVLLKVGSRLCIPRVKEGRYIRIHWYRHSDNNGDRCRITNGVDLDGTVINPADVIRFTGSHYYANEASERDNHKGSFVFRVKKHDSTTDTKNFEVIDDTTYCDVFIDPYGIGWTEFYRIEIMDKFDSELQLAEVDVAEKITADQIIGKRTQADIGKPQATIDAWNSHDLNDAASYNRKVFNAEKANHPVLASQLTSRITTHAKGATLVKNAPELYISGYPGHCYTWNGWLNTTLQADFMGTSASCNIETKTDGSWSQERTIPAEPVWVGNNLQYTMHPLKNVQGEGTIKLTLRTHSGWQGEPHYTFDKREAIVAVGQYSVQEYPYTWDFTDYNFGKDNAYGDKTYTTMSDGNVNVEKQYGYWKKNGDAWEMGTYQNSITSKYTVGSYYIDVNDTKKVNLPKFAQGAQLALGTNGEKHTILETEGLRINIPAVNSSNNSAVVLNPNDGTLNGTLTVNGTITIPEVQKGMFVFVRSTNQPTNVVGAVDRNSGDITSKSVSFYTDVADVPLRQADIPSNVWVYEQTEEGLHDVVITPNGAVEALGVTDYFKLTTIGAGKTAPEWMTDSRAERIDYNNSALFTKHTLSAYIATQTPDLDSNDEGALQLTNVQVVPAQKSGVNRGLVLQDVTSVGGRPLIPLFVPACNIPDDNIDNNIIKELINGGELQKSTSTQLRYILSNQYFNYDKATDKLKDNEGVKVVKDIDFYILRADGATRENSAYLELVKSSGHANTRLFYLVISDSDSDALAIQEVAIDEEGVHTKEVEGIYTLTGVKLNGVPTKAGVYVINGKKIYVK